MATSNCDLSPKCHVL